MRYDGKSVLVTGADGFIGSHVVEQLAAAGATVTALALYDAFDRSGWLDSLPAETRSAIRIERGDMRDSGFVTRLIAGHDIAFHLAALIAIPYSYAAAQSYVDVNVTGTLNLFEAARAHGLQRIVHTSTSEVYGTARTVPIVEDHPLQAQSPYAASKIGGDMMAMAYARSFDLPVVVLRPFNTYGPRQSERAVIASVIRQALDPACEAVQVGDTTPRRDFTFVGDTAAAFLSAGGADGLEFGEPYNCGSGAAVTIGEMIDTVQSIAGTSKPIETEAARFRPENSEVRMLLADTTRFAMASGWRPRTDFRTGLGQTIAWWRERLEAGTVRPDARYSV